MMLTIANVLDAAQVQQCRQLLEQAEWTDGRATAGHMAVKAKRNLQLPLDSSVAERIGELVLSALSRSPRFMAAALPLKVFPPRFNCYQDGGEYGNHVDNAIFSVPGTAHRIRGDVSASLFFSEPEQYDGGELIIEDSYGQHSVKLPAGHMVLYPSSSLHRVNPVTRGARYASFFWIQSLIREASQRSMLLELDDAIQALSLQVPGSAELERLTCVYHNLLRRWAQT